MPASAIDQNNPHPCEVINWPKRLHRGNYAKHFANPPPFFRKHRTREVSQAHKLLEANRDDVGGFKERSTESLVRSPERRHEQNQDREQFQSAEQHQQGEQQLALRRKLRVVHRRSNCPQTGTDVVQRRRNG